MPLIRRVLMIIAVLGLGAALIFFAVMAGYALWEEHRGSW